MPIEDGVREAIDTFMVRVRHDADAHLRSLTSDVLRLVQDREDTWRSEMERAVGEARADAEATFRTHVETLRGELTREMELRLVGERADSQMAQDAVRSGARDGRLDTLERLLGVVRRLDEAVTLTGILETLAKGAAAEASRVAIMLVEDGMLRSWGHFGFSADVAPVDLPDTEARLLTAAVALRQTSFVQPSVDGRDTSVPAFMRVPAGHTGLVVPIIVGTEVVAVLYADDVGRLPEHEDAPVWTEEVELLVRHASVRLENVTSIQAAELLSKPA
jgi:hypothetical protein